MTTIDTIFYLLAVLLITSVIGIAVIRLVRNSFASFLVLTGTVAVLFVAHAKGYLSTIAFRLSSLIVASLVAVLLYRIIRGNTDAEPLKGNYERVDLLPSSVFGPGAVIENVFAGVYIGGAAGSGKTRAVLIRLFKHFARHRFANIVYCYKDFELVEYGLPVFTTTDYIIFAPASPEISDKINPLNPYYFHDESEIKAMFIEMMTNMYRGKKDDEKSLFFRNAAVGLATGLTWILKNRMPEYCTLPHLASIITNSDIQTLMDLVSTDHRAKVQASTFLTSTGDQMSAVIGSVYNFFTSFLTPFFCYTMFDPKGEYRDLKVNDPNNPVTLYLVNDMARESVVLPIINSVFYLCCALLPKGKKYRTSIIVDEMSTINLEGFSRKPATLRSYDVATIGMIQDLSLAVENSNETTPRAIISNLSAQYLGKVNDPKSAELYEKIFEFIEKDQYSYGNDSSIFVSNPFNTRINKSIKEQKKFRAPDLFRLKTGEFLHFPGGNTVKSFFPYQKNIAKANVPVKQEVTQRMLNDNYEEILSFGKNFKSLLQQTS